MFGFLKRKVREIKSPVDGQVVALESVKDDVFSQKLVGDGVAIVPMSDVFTAPIDGKITKIFSTNHAYSIKSSKDLEVMVHIGLETVALEGKGFERLANEGDEVKAELDHSTTKLDDGQYDTHRDQCCHCRYRPSHPRHGRGLPGGKRGQQAGYKVSVFLGHASFPPGGHIRGVTPEPGRFSAALPPGSSV